MHTPATLPALDLSFLDDWTFVHGVGSFDDHEACAMSAASVAVALQSGATVDHMTDLLTCVDPVIRSLVIRRNDLTPEADLKAWALSMIPRIVGTNSGKALTVKRAEYIARYACRVIAADAMDSAKLPDEAAKLRALGDDAPMSACREVASAARDTANKERQKRYAAAYAADAAYDAAYAAAYAARRTTVRLAHLDAMIALCLEVKA